MNNAAVNDNSVRELLALAVRQHNAGKLAEAEGLYRQILSRQGDHPDALSLLGTVMCVGGRRDEAIDLIGRAVSLRPACAEFHFNLGQALREAGRLPEAAASLATATELRPGYVEALTSLGQTLSQLGQTDSAVAPFEKAVELRPDLAETQNNLGNALGEVRRFHQAIPRLMQAIAINPRLAGAHSNLGNAYFGLGEFDAAVAAYRQAIELEPASVQFQNNLAVALRAQRKFDESIACCRRAIEIDPDDARSHGNLGSGLAVIGELDEAEAAYRRALSLSPTDLEAYGNLGHVFYFKGQWDKAQSVYQTILTRQADYAQAHWSLALILLTLGRYEQAWPHYEWRWRVKELRMRLRAEAPRWDGGNLNGRTILLHNEQGFGDTIQFVRYLPEVAARGGKIILACQPELFSLLKGLPLIERCVANDEASPPHDVSCPLLSLPGVLGTTAENIPADIPYLFAEAGKIEEWRQRLSGESRLKIGLAWAGRAAHPNDYNRSLNIGSFVSLAEAANVRWINLQLGPAAVQMQNSSLALEDWTSELKDFSDTAALIANLDLVICADTAVAHLAGAMGKRVWVLLPFIPDWRWMLKRSDSPWYPTTRLFRQPRIGDWATPIAQVAAALNEMGQSK